MQTVRIPRPPSVSHHMNPQQHAYGHPQQQQQQHAPQPHPGAHPSQQYHYAPTPPGPPQQQPSYAAYSQSGAGQPPPPGQEYDDQAMRRPAGMAGQRDPAAVQQQQQQQQQHQQQQQQQQQQQYQQQQQMMRAQRPPPSNVGANGGPAPAGYTASAPSHGTGHPNHPSQQQQQQQQPPQGHTPQPPPQARPSMQRSSSSNLHIQMPPQQFMPQGASQSSMATSGISPVAQQGSLSQSGPPPQPPSQAPTPQAQPGPNRLGESSSQQQQFAQQQQQQQQQAPGQAPQRPPYYYTNGAASSPTQAGAPGGGAQPQQQPSFRPEMRQGSMHGELMARSIDHGALPGVSSVNKGKGRARAPVEPAVSKEEEERQFVELVYEFLYKARLFGTARSLLAELSGDSSSSLPDGGAHSPGSVHSSPRDMLIMGESPRHDDPSSGMVKRKRTSDSESSMNNGAGGGRADEKDDKGEGQLPSPVSGTGADATKDGAGDKKDDGAKEELGDGAGRDKGRGGRSSGKGDGAGARERLELRKPEVEGSDRSERGILIEWWTIFNDFRQIQTASTLATHPPVTDAEMYLSSFGQHSGPPPGAIARTGAHGPNHPNARAGSMNGMPGRGPPAGYPGRTIMDVEGPQQGLGNGLPSAQHPGVRYVSQPGQPGRPPQYAGGEAYGVRQPTNPAAQAHHRQLIGRIEEMGLQLNIAPDRIQQYIRSPLPQLASIADGLQAQLNSRGLGPGGEHGGEPSPKRVKMDGTPVPPPGGAVPKLSLQQQQQLALRHVQSTRAPGMQMHPNVPPPGAYGEEYSDPQSRAQYAAMMQRRMSQQAALVQNGQSPNGGPMQMLPPAPPGYAQSPVGQQHPSQYDMSRPPSQMSYHSSYTPQAGGPPAMMARSESVADYHSEYAATPRMQQSGFEAASPSTAKVPGKAAPASKAKAKAAPKKAKPKAKPPTSPIPPSPAPPLVPTPASNHASPQVFNAALTPANTTSPHPGGIQPSPAGAIGSPFPPSAPTPQHIAQLAQDQHMQQQQALEQGPRQHQLMQQQQQQHADQMQQLQQQQQQNGSLADGGVNTDAGMLDYQAGDSGDYPFASVDINDPSLMAMFAGNPGDPMLDLDAELGTDFDFSSWMVDSESHEPPAA